MLGLAEPIRLALAISGERWEDHQINGDDYVKLIENGELPWGMVPVLKTPHGVLAESGAILRYAGDLSGLVPNDSWNRAKVNEICDTLDNMIDLLRPSWGIRTLASRIAFRHALIAGDGEMTRWFTLFDELLSKQTHGWCAGTKSISIADLKLFTIFFGWTSGQYDGFEEDMLDGYENIINHHHLVSNHPKVFEYYQNLEPDDIRVVYQPR